MASTDSILFWIVFTFVLFINIVTPFIAAGFNESYTGHDTSGIADEAPGMASILGISGLNIILVPFWTLTMPTLMNLFIMLPIRALGWILIIRMIRGI